MRFPVIVLLAAPLLAATGCGNREETNVEPPAELIEFESALQPLRLWSRRIGRGTERLRLGLEPSTDGTRIFAASSSGRVSALETETGREVWTVAVDEALSAGPGVGAGFVIVGTSNGDLVALDTETGEERWRRPVGAQVLAAPAIGGNTVVFRTIDGRLRGVALSDGAERWSVEQSLPALTLRGDTVPRVAGTVVVSGFDNGRVGAYTLTEGETRWELAIATPSGRNELEQLVDVSPGLQVVGNDVYAVSYQGRAVGLDLVTGLVIWQRELSSFSGLGVDASAVYVTDDVGAVIALDRRDGTELWRQEALRRRDVTAPTRFGPAVVVGDFEGYLHWIDPADGQFVGRTRGASGAITAPPLVVGLVLYVQGEDGTLTAFQIPDDQEA